MKWIPQLKSAFAHVVPVASGMNWTTPYAESNVTFPSFDQIVSNQTNSPPRTTSGPSASISLGSAGASASVTGNNAAVSAGPSGTTSAGAGAASSSRAAAGRVEAGLGGVVLAAVLAWASL